jgi:hypothetical protein
MPRTVWSHHEDLTLARLYMAGEPVDLIAAALNRTVPMITTRASTLGLRRRKLKDATSRHGNAAWVIGAALRSALPEDKQPFAQDLLDKLM